MTAGRPIEITRNAYAISRRMKSLATDVREENVARLDGWRHSRHARLAMCRSVMAGAETCPIVPMKVLQAENMKENRIINAVLADVMTTIKCANENDESISDFRALSN